MNKGGWKGRICLRDRRNDTLLEGLKLAMSYETSLRHLRYDKVRCKLGCTDKTDGPLTLIVATFE